MIVRYLKVGILNTLLTLTIIFIGVNILNINYNISYFIGYIIGLINSFLFNKHYTFQSTTKWTKEFLPFIVVFLISYASSHIILVALIEKLYLYRNTSIIISMIIFTAISYILNKKVFKGK